jgi:hypothetical protein
MKRKSPEGGSLRAGWNLQFQRERLAFSFKLSQGTGRIGYLHLLRGAGAFIKRLCEKILSCDMIFCKYKIFKW